ncbi:MAG: hypothetical protein K5755_04680 [Clostridiales bacterium]|nr:hypothetical protein [Clostridiales bacterium]
MATYEKRKNIIGGAIMYSLMLLSCIISCISYIPTFARGYATPYTYCYFVETILMFLIIIAAFIVMIIRKRQSGFGVALPMAESLVSQIAFFIALIIQNSSSYYRAHPNWTTYLTFLLIIPIILVIIYFFVPNTALKVISALTVIIALIVRMTSTLIEIIRAINGHYFRGMYAFSVFLGLTMAVLLYSLIVVQIFVSFKKAGAPAAVYPQAGYVPAQPVAPVQPREVPKEEILKNYQNLLTNNLITPEQYEEKRKELFGE